MEEWIFTKAVVNVSWERGEVLQVVLLGGQTTYLGGLEGRKKLCE